MSQAERNHSHELSECYKCEEGQVNVLEDWLQHECPAVADCVGITDHCQMIYSTLHVNHRTLNQLHSASLNQFFILTPAVWCSF